jgi:hypothetical protein
MEQNRILGNLVGHEMTAEEVKEVAGAVCPMQTGHSNGPTTTDN